MKISCTISKHLSSFNFIIVLHQDDKGVLEYIHRNLRLGQVTLSSTRPEAKFIIRTQAEISVLLELFSKYPLNTTKRGAARERSSYLAAPRRLLINLSSLEC